MDRQRWLVSALERYERPLVGYAYRLLGDLERARDVVQDTFLRLCQQDRAELDGRVKEWLFAVCRNRAIDSLKEAQKVLVDGLGGTLVAIAKDVKIQIFFNPREVAGYRLIGYANRMLEKEDFNDDTKDAGDIGAGHAVTALYELVPAGQEVPKGNVDRNPFVAENKPSDLADTGTLFLLRLRYKLPDADRSTLLKQSVMDRDGGFDGASPDFQWASAVAALGMLLRDSPHKGHVTWETVLEVARTHAGADSYRQQFLGLVERARALAPK